MRAELVGSSPRIRATLQAFCYCAIWRRAEGCLRENREAGGGVVALGVGGGRAPRLRAPQADSSPPPRPSSRRGTPPPTRRQPLEAPPPPAAPGSGGGR